MSSRRVCLFFDRLCWLSAHLHVPVIWQWTVKREEDIISFYTSGWKSLDGFKQAAQAMTYWWFVRIAQKLERRRRSQVDEKFPKIGACSSHESGGSQKFGKSVASATTLFSIKDTLYCLKLMFSNKKKKTMKPSYLPVSLSHDNNKKNFLGEGHQDFGTHPNCLRPQFDWTCGSEDPDWKILVTSLQWNKITLGSWR